MTRRYPVHRIKIHMIYSIREVSDLLHCHKRTVSRWVKEEGLIADKSQKQWLIRGEDLKPFLGHRQEARRHRMALHECFCFACKAPREPAARMADYVHETATAGQLKALCPECSTIMNKKVRRSDLDAIRARIEVTVQPPAPRIVSLEEPRETVTFRTEDQTHAKAQP